MQCPCVLQASMILFQLHNCPVMWLIFISVSEWGVWGREMLKKWLGYKWRLDACVKQNIGAFLSFFFSFLFASPKPLPCLSTVSTWTLGSWWLNSHWKRWQAANPRELQFLGLCQHLGVRCLLSQQLMLGCWEEGAGLFCLLPNKNIVFELLSSAEMRWN